MSMRLSASLVVVALVAIFATVAQAAHPPIQELRPRGDDPFLNPTAPILFRTSAGTTWVRVHNPDESPCDPADAGPQDEQTVEHVWCFEGANGDSTWPAVPAGQNTGSNHEDFDHWSNFDPPIAPPSKWHITTRHENPGEVDTYNAWAGCDSLNTSGVCTDLGFWVFQDGYGNLWNFPLELDASGQNASTGGTIEFDLRYDTECDYDYLYLEYFDTVGSMWTVVNDSAGAPAVFNSISGNPDTTLGGTGKDCGDDIYHHSDEKDLGEGPEAYHGNSIWLEDVTFPMPDQAGGMKLRWRARSDQFWSDEDGSGDTDGIAAIDNVLLTFDASGVTVSDDFETGDFNGITASSGSATWIPQGQTIDENFNTYDGWHLEFDPMYKNKGNVCAFSDDWMWASKPASGSLPPESSGFDFWLVTPVIDADGWTGAVCQYDRYLCMESARSDFVDVEVRVYDNSVPGWSAWNNIDGFITFAGCDFWNTNINDDLTPWITATVDSLQVGWQTLDLSQDGTFAWGKHGGVQHLVDNISIGSFDGESTIFTFRNIDIFADTFSRSDPAHTPFLSNSEMGLWSGITGAGFDRDFTAAESLTVALTDFNGISAANVSVFWRHDDGGVGFGAWNSKTMDFSFPDVTSPSDEGTYRQIIGDDLGGVEDVEGTASNGLIWKAGTTVEYYVGVTDNNGNFATSPDVLSGNDPFEFSVLPFGNTTPNGNKILIVDDYTRALVDVEKSTGFDPSGGVGFGAFSNAVTVQPEFMVRDALDIIYSNQGGSAIVDKYDVQGGGTSVQTEPRGISDVARGLGGYMNDFGVPEYDALIWMQGTFDANSYADTTRIELSTYLDNGGYLISNGDQVNFHLGSGGNNADSTIGFIGDYLGTSFPSAADEETDNRVLDIAGESGSEFDGYLHSLYGECPIRRTFDRLTLATPGPQNSNRVLYRYANSTAGDNGRPAVIYNVRQSTLRVDLGAAANFAFGFTALHSRVTLAAILDNLLHESTLFGLADPGYDAVDVPGLQVGNGARFELAAAAPNPFRGNTAISFSVAKRTHVSIEVFNVLGQKVRTLVDEPLEADSYVRNWDGRSDEGATVSSGIYFYKMVAGDFSDTKKAVVLR